MEGSSTAPSVAPGLAPEQAAAPSLPVLSAVPHAHAAVGDRLVIGWLGAVLIVILALTWRRWGIIDTDTGTELTVAEMVSHGAVAYRDVRYFYGPAGVYSLAFAFKLFGTSLSTAVLFGLLQSVAILVTFYVLARSWVRPLAAGLATTALMVVGFSGWANFVMPNTTSATFGLLFILLLLLALTRGRLWLAGVAFGILMLTRVEFAAAGAITIAAFTVGLQRESGRGVALRALGPMLAPALAIAGGVLGMFAREAGLSRLITVNLLPVGFMHSEAAYQRNLSPLTLSSLVAVGARGLVYMTLVGSLVACALRWRRASGLAGRLRASWPLAFAVLTLFALDGVSRVLDAFPGTRSLVQTESKRMLIGMSWLPALALAAAVLALIRFIRRERAPFSGSWPMDLALLACGCLLSLRVYDSFTTDTFAPYYAAPLLLLAAIFHERVGDRWPGAKRMSLVAFGLVVLSLALALARGTTAGHTEMVRSARGEFGSTPAAAPALQGAIDFLRDHTRAGEEILALPYGGLYALVNRPPALYNLAFLPGDVSSTGEQRAAIARLQHMRIKYVALGNARFDAWGASRIGVNYDRTLIAFIRRRFRVAATFGDFSSSSGGPLSQAFEILERR